MVSCPVRCIEMAEDAEGFLYPEADVKRCTDCHRCEQVCPVINPKKERTVREIYAAINKDDEVRVSSSSGGAFTVLAENVINEGGVVFGAAYDDSSAVIHTYTETKDGLAAFRGSKYVQSDMGEAFLAAKHFLDDGRFVLFSGAPCQIAGLFHFLDEDYENLTTVDFICHGVPSPKVFRDYLHEIKTSYCSSSYDPELHLDDIRITDVSFRNKERSWRDFTIVIEAERRSLPATPIVLCKEPHEQNIFYRGFIQHLYLRPSCHDCPARGFKSGSDVTLGDYWGVDRDFPELDHQRGVSVIMVHNSQKITLDRSLLMKKTSIENVLRYNPHIFKSPEESKFRSKFFQNYPTTELIKNISAHLVNERPFFKRYKKKAKKIIRKLLKP